LEVHWEQASIHKKTPSVPTDFRPAQFAFMPQPDFQSARENMEKEDEEMVIPEPE
jgi:hypothetical protein